MTARIAYFVMAHRLPDQLDWLIEAIQDPGDLILLHVDLKSRLGLKPDRRGIYDRARALAARHRNVRLMRSHFTNWGGWSLSRLQLDAIDMALDLSPDWTHFVNLSGQCYPIKPLAQIHDALDRLGDRVMIELRPFDTLPADDWHLRWHPMIELPVRAIKLRGPAAPPTGFEMTHKGSQWSILPRAFCEWQRVAPVGREIRQYLRRLLLSDELIMQTLVRNGPWRDRVAPHYGRELVWPGPKVMTMADRDLLERSTALYARKFDAGQDAAILLALAARCGLRLPPQADKAAGQAAGLAAGNGLAAPAAIRVGG